MFDLTIFPLSLETGREQYELPGLLVVSAPRKAARMRAQDQLVLYCKLRMIPGGGTGGVPSTPSNTLITHGQLREILARLAETYFTFSGSVTAGLRVVVARLNDFLLNRNLKAAQEGQTVGTLNLAVIHGNRLVVAHAGTTHSFVLTKTEVLHFDDGQAGRGLGLSRQAMPRFYQAAVDAGDMLVVCADPPAGWNAKALANSPQLSFDHLRRRLSSNAGPELQVGVIRLQVGKGQISYWRPGDAAKVPAAGVSGKAPLHGRHTARPAPVVPDTQTEGTNLPEPIVESRASDAEEAVAEPGLAESASALEADAPTTGQALSYAVPEPPVETPILPEEENMFAESLPSQESLQDSPTSAANPVVPLENAAAAEISEQRSPVAAPPPGTGTAAQPARSMERQSEAVLAAPPMATPSRAGGRVDRSERIRRDKGAAQKPIEHRAPVHRSLPRKPGALQTGLASASAKIRQFFYQAARFLVDGVGKISGGMSRAVPRQVDPEGRVVPFFNLSPAQMVAIAIFVPLIVVAVGTTVYVRSGLSEQFLDRLSVAKSYAEQAAKLTDPAQQREGWKQAYAVLLEAEKLGRNDESQALNQQISKALDDLEGYVRVDYQPAVSAGSLGEASITDMVATLNDVYLLDSSQGRILHLIRTASSYMVDPKFNCGPGTAGTVIINPLIDLVALPANNEMHSSVVGIDAGGNLVYCAPNLTGFDSRPLALPDNGWGKIAGITIFGNSLYVLDPKGNAVYRYDGTDGVFTERPHLFFDNTIPQMGDVVDLAVDQEFLYLLHADGRMTICESSGFAFAGTKCTDPAPYGDSRPGYEQAPLVFPGSHFIHILTTQPPDPSLFALDAANKSVYHLSLRRMNLQRQYRPAADSGFPLPNEAATAFAVTPLNQRVLIAFGNRVFFAPLP